MAAPDFLSAWQARFRQDLYSYVILYATTAAISFAWRSREQLARQRELLVQAQLDALRRQIEPHFLFNSLNSIVSLIREGRPSDAIDVTVELGDLMRRLLDDSGRTLVPLFEEFDFLGKYLAIQQVRFGERLVIAIDRPDELAMAQVPALILQPLAENALKHGIGRRVEGGTLDIKVAREDGLLSIRVENDAPPLPPERQDGIGLSNIRARLASLYGDQADLIIGAGAPGKVLVTVSLPYRPA
jgi:LytS/YehU family sensor histidine kinase